MDSNHNPLKKNRFNRDTYLTQFQMPASDPTDTDEDDINDQAQEIIITNPAIEAAGAVITDDHQDRELEMIQTVFSARQQQPKNITTNHALSPNTISMSTADNLTTTAGQKQQLASVASSTHHQHLSSLQQIQTQMVQMVSQANQTQKVQFQNQQDHQQFPQQQRRIQKSATEKSLLTTSNHTNNNADFHQIVGSSATAEVQLSNGINPALQQTYHLENNQSKQKDGQQNQKTINNKFFLNTTGKPHKNNNGNSKKQQFNALKQMDLLQADNRRRQANFLRQNPTFRMSNNRHKLTDTSNKTLTNLAANSLYFKRSNTYKKTKNHQDSVDNDIKDKDKELQEKAARKVAMQDSMSLLASAGKIIQVIELDGNQTHLDGSSENLVVGSDDGFESQRDQQQDSLNIKQKNTAAFQNGQLDTSSQQLKDSIRTEEDDNSEGQDGQGENENDRNQRLDQLEDSLQQIQKQQLQHQDSHHQGATTRAFHLTEYDAKTKTVISNDSSPKMQQKIKNKAVVLRRSQTAGENFLDDLCHYRIKSISNPNTFAQKAFNSELLALPWQQQTNQTGKSNAIDKKKLKRQFLSAKQPLRQAQKVATFGFESTRNHYRHQSSLHGGPNLFGAVSGGGKSQEDEQKLAVETVGDHYRIACQMKRVGIQKYHSLDKKQFRQNLYEASLREQILKKAAQQQNSSNNFNQQSNGGTQQRNSAAAHLAACNSEGNMQSFLNQSRASNSQQMLTVCEIQTPMSTSRPDRSTTDLHNASNSTTFNGQSDRTKRSKRSQVPNNYEERRRKQNERLKDLKRRVLIPSQKEQQEIARQLCKDTKYATLAELTLDTNRKLIMKEIKSRGCYDESKDKRKKQQIQERRKKELARMKDESRQKRKIIKTGGMSIEEEAGAAEMIDTIDDDDIELSSSIQMLKRQATLSKKHDNWFDVTDDSENSGNEEGNEDQIVNSIPCKDQLPGPARNINSIKVDKYKLHDCIDQNGNFKEHKITEAYEKYYEKKFDRMRDKQDMEVYKDYLSRVRSEYESKNKKIFSNRSQATNFTQQIRCLPAKSRLNVYKKIKEEQERKKQHTKQSMRREVRQTGQKSNLQHYNQHQPSHKQKTTPTQHSATPNAANATGMSSTNQRQTSSGLAISHTHRRKLSHQNRSQDTEHENHHHKKSNINLDDDQSPNEITIESKLTGKQRRSKFMVMPSESFNEEFVFDPSRRLKESKGLQRQDRILPRNFKQLDEQSAEDEKFEKRLAGLSPYKSADFPQRNNLAQSGEKRASLNFMKPLEEIIQAEKHEEISDSQSQKSQYIDTEDSQKGSRQKYKHHID